MTSIKYIKLLDLLYKFPNTIEKVKLNYCNLLSNTEIDTIIFLEKVKSIHRNGCIIVAYTHGPESENFDIIGSAKILIESKIIEIGNDNRNFVGHIEDLIVKPEYKDKNILHVLLEELKYIALERNCYKVVLNYIENNQNVFLKSGFEKKGIHMTHYFTPTNI